MMAPSAARFKRHRPVASASGDPFTLEARTYVSGIAGSLAADVGRLFAAVLDGCIAAYPIPR